MITIPNQYDSAHNYNSEQQSLGLQFSPIMQQEKKIAGSSKNKKTYNFKLGQE